MDKLKQIKREIIKKYQRADNGYSDEDLWEFDEYLAKIIKEGCYILAQESYGYPVQFEKLGDEKGRNKWKQILLDISFGFGSYIEMRSGIYSFDEKEFKRLNKEYKNGLKLFLEFHEYLWD